MIGEYGLSSAAEVTVEKSKASERLGLELAESDPSDAAKPDY